MTYKDIKFVIGKAYLHINKLKHEIGENNYNFCAQCPIGAKYALWYIVDTNNNYKLIYSNFKKDYPIFELPYISPSINKNLPF